MAPPTDATNAFLNIILKNPINRLLIERLFDFGLSDAWLVAGCLFQTVWNVKAGQSPTFGISDYDIFYFNDSDPSWEAENEDIRRVGKLLDDLDARVELKNQARVHLWYGERFGPGYPQLKSSCEGIDRFLIGCTRVGVRLNLSIDLYAPDGLDDLYRGVLRPNPINDRPELFLAKAKSYQARWPWLSIEENRSNDRQP